ncbi:MAG: ABC transporter ATP-binding protein [Acetobacteraceae bacterium]
MAEPILEVRDIRVEYASPDGPARAVDGVSFAVGPGEFLGIVGESGCGKSTLLFAITRLLAPSARLTGGEILFKGQNLVALTERALRAIRWRDYSVVMQSAMNALNPVRTIAAQYADAMRAHGIAEARTIRERSREVLSLVGIDPVHLKSFPHQLSGGMRQRVMIAMALLLSPELIVMDEPTSALDVVAQRSLLAQIKILQRRLGFAVIFVTHDMSLVGHFSDRLAVMYAGEIVEIGPTRRIFDFPAHPYTQGLLESFPSVHGPKLPLQGIPGSPPNLAMLPTGCRFHPRCAKAMERCSTTSPPFYPVGPAAARCFLLEPARAHARA